MATTLTAMLWSGDHFTLADAQWPRTPPRCRSPRVRFHGRDGTGDAADRGPRDAGQPVHLALAKARIDRGPDRLAAAATDRVLLGGPAGQHLPGPADRQPCHASRYAFAARTAMGARPRSPGGGLPGPAAAAAGTGRSAGPAAGRAAPAGPEPAPPRPS